MSRITGTPIQEEIKIRPKRHLLETRIQKKRLQRIIAELGETEDNESNNSILEEKELMKIKQDFTIEADELAIYESLIGAL